MTILIDILLRNQFFLPFASDCGSFSLYFILSPYVPHDEIFDQTLGTSMRLRLSTGSMPREEARGKRSKVRTTYFGSETEHVTLVFTLHFSYVVVTDQIMQRDATRCRE